jgi:hypothetical protein
MSFPGGGSEPTLKCSRTRSASTGGILRGALAKVFTDAVDVARGLLDYEREHGLAGTLATLRATPERFGTLQTAWFGRTAQARASLPEVVEPLEAAIRSASESPSRDELEAAEQHAAEGIKAGIAAREAEGGATHSCSTVRARSPGPARAPVARGFAAVDRRAAWAAATAGGPRSGAQQSARHYSILPCRHPRLGKGSPFRPSACWLSSDEGRFPENTCGGQRDGNSASSPRIRWTRRSCSSRRHSGAGGRVRRR